MASARGYAQVEHRSGRSATGARAAARLRLFAVLAVLVLTATACFLEDAYQGQAAGTHVIVLGDSITSNAGDDLHRALDPTYEVKLSGWVGGRFDQGISEGHKYTTQSPLPTRVVIEYGTNDSASTDTVDTSLAKMDAIIGEFPTACVVLVNVGTWFPDPGHRPAYIAGLNAAMSLAADGVVDRALARAQAAGDDSITRDQVAQELRLGSIVLADYKAVLGADLATNFATDKAKIHPSSAGNVVYAGLVKSALDQCPPEVETTTTPSTTATSVDDSSTTTESEPETSTTDTSSTVPDEATTTVPTDPPTTDPTTTTPDETTPTSDDVPTTEDVPPDTSVP